MPVNYNIVADVGASFRLDMVWKPEGAPADLRSYTASMDVRDANNNLIIHLSSTTNPPRILLGGKSGSIVLQITAADMLTVPASGTPPYNYDLFLDSPDTPSVKTKLLYGTFTVNASVTAAP